MEDIISRNIHVIICIFLLKDGFIFWISANCKLTVSSSTYQILSQYSNKSK